MGTGGAPVTVRAATLAGGDKNQDRYAYGDGWAFVLDGASSFSTVQPEHDGGWYAERLKKALIYELTSQLDDVTDRIVARAIEAAASAHDNPDTCPTSTIALARWTTEMVEAYVLGDSTAVIIGSEGEEAITDARLAGVALDLRDEYHDRLSAGHGFDEQHATLLQSLQKRQVEARNRAGGYWIAGAAPVAAGHAVIAKRARTGQRIVALATDGAASGLRYGTIQNWTDAALVGPEPVLEAIHAAEATDPHGTRWPRSKPHDDKTLLTLHFARP